MHKEYLVVSFSFSIVIPYLLNFMTSHKKQTVNLNKDPFYVMTSLLLLSRVSLPYLAFVELFRCADNIFHQSVKFLAIISSNTFCAHYLLFFWDSHYACLYTWWYPTGLCSFFFILLFWLDTLNWLVFKFVAFTSAVEHLKWIFSLIVFFQSRISIWFLYQFPFLCYSLLGEKIVLTLETQFLLVLWICL